MYTYIYIYKHTHTYISTALPPPHFRHRTVDPSDSPTWIPIPEAKIAAPSGEADHVWIRCVFPRSRAMTPLDPQGHGTPENGKRYPYYSHIFRDSYGSGMGIV